MKIAPGEIQEFSVNPNQYKNTITIIDNETGFIVFMTINDYSVYSNYYSQISPPNFLFQGTRRFRTFKINGIEQRVSLKNVAAMGIIYLWQEMDEAGKRQQKWMDSFFASQNYFKTYTKEQRVSLKNVAAMGIIYLWQEMDEAGKRQQKWMDSFFASQNYFKTYTKTKNGLADGNGDTNRFSSAKFVTSVMTRCNIFFRIDIISHLMKLMLVPS